MKLFLFLTALIVAGATGVESCTPADRQALLDFKAALNEPYLGIFKSWSGNDCCSSWFGISCDSDGPDEFLGRIDDRSDAL